MRSGRKVLITKMTDRHLARAMAFLEHRYSEELAELLTQFPNARRREVGERFPVYDDLLDERDRRKEIGWWTLD